MTPPPPQELRQLYPVDSPSTHEWSSIGEAFVAAVRACPSSSFIRTARGLCLSYESVAARVVFTMRWLTSLGLGRGDRLVCYEERTIPLTIIDLSCAFLGIVPVPLSYLYSPGYLGRLTSRVGAKFVFVAPNRAKEVSSAGLSPIWFPCNGGADCLPGEAFESDICAVLDAALAERADDELFMIMPTSGSSGEPKLVARRDRAFLRYAKYVGHQIRLTSSGQERFLAVAALTHAFGMHMLATAIALGAELVIPTDLDTSASLAEIRALDPTVIPMTPRVLRSLCRQVLPDDARVFGPQARVVVVGGGAADISLFKKLGEQGVETLELYGSTEASLVALTPCGKWQPGFAGRLVDDVEAKISFDGELLVRTPGMMVGYLGEPEDTKSHFDAEGYFNTGDFGDIGPERWLRIRGRKKDVFNTPEGANIYPARIEGMIETIPWVQQVMLVGDRFISAFIVVPEGEGQNMRVDGFLPLEGNAGLYERARKGLAKINENLERVEQVACVALFGRHFPRDIYQYVSGAKIRRTRDRFIREYASVIAFIYNDATTSLHEAMFVPGSDRRIRPRLT